MKPLTPLRLLDLGVTVGDDLILSYSVENTSAEELGIFDRVPVALDMQAPPSYAPSNAYIGVDGATLVVRKAVLPIPRGLSVAERLVPGITRLAPESSRHEQISLALPVHAFDPYRKAGLRLSEPEAVGVDCLSPRTVDRVRLILGWFPLRNIRLLPLSPGEEVFRAHPPDAPFGSYSETAIEAPAPRGFDALEYEVILAPTKPS